MNQKNLIYVAVGVLILFGLFFYLKNKSGNTNPGISENQTTASSSAEASNSATTANEKVFELVVKNNKLVSGPDTLQVTQGDNVTIRITADVDGELHLHGYDKIVDFKTNQPAEIKFTAAQTGRFEYELENTKTEIGALEVSPK